ncbi:PREDICTED: probable palmitoyltransferase ZDHHC12 [Branchiostoma belcheri]|uniref:Palmitoyltransferase n=1 Tax=Branchiostoma belcheri TaxID=7741 RepID=A0A6P4Y9V0_BRABE|nr:PREDICTED: probable palmitoyltransferase ZDHHC12 [Branchiostoma belcheri]
MAGVWQRPCWRMLFSTAVLVRSFHVCITTGVVSLLFFKDTALRQQLISGDYLVPCIYMALVFLSLVLYAVVCSMDPGFVSLTNNKNAIRKGQQCVESNSEEDDSVSATETSVMIEPDIGLKPRVKLRNCGFCGIQQPIRAKHCELCGFCIHRFDHHCPWFETCIGERNHRFFWIFLLVETSLVGWTVHLVWTAFVYEESWTSWFVSNGLYLVAMFVLVLGGTATFLLVASHTYLIGINLTTWEFMSRHRITYLKDYHGDENPFDEGLLKNLWKFFLHLRLKDWELYLMNRPAKTLGRA